MTYIPPRSLPLLGKRTTTTTSTIGTASTEPSNVSGHHMQSQPSLPPHTPDKEHIVAHIKVKTSTSLPPTQVRMVESRPSMQLDFSKSLLVDNVPHDLFHDKSRKYIANVLWQEPTSTMISPPSTLPENMQSNIQKFVPLPFVFSPLLAASDDEEADFPLTMKRKLLRRRHVRKEQIQRRRQERDRQAKVSSMPREAEPEPEQLANNKKRQRVEIETNPVEQSTTMATNNNTTPPTISTSSEQPISSSPRLLLSPDREQSISDGQYYIPFVEKTGEPQKKSLDGYGYEVRTTIYRGGFSPNSVHVPMSPLLPSKRRSVRLCHYGSP